MNYDDLKARLTELSPKLSPLFSQEFGDAVIGVDSSALLSTARELAQIGFDRLGMVTAVDRDEFFVVVYRLHSRSLTTAVFLKTRVPRDEPRVDSVCGVWPAANWHEREVFDLFGIDFTGHPDMRRILLSEDWVGHPLRKDYEDEHTIHRPDYI